MRQVRFSIIVPTRDRAETLDATLRTCLDQRFTDYEVVVCDNFSSPATKSVVDQLASDRLRYVRTNEPLAMSANWELALTHARGEFLCVIGDDDALMPYALRELDALVQRTNAKAVRWDWIVYCWPSVQVARDANYVMLPLARNVREISSRESLRRVIGPCHDYSPLPMIYHGVVHRSVVERVREIGGRVFGSAYPDVYSAFAFSSIVRTFQWSGLPMSVAGLSGKSNGMATLRAETVDRTAREFEDLNNKFGFRPHPRVPPVRGVLAVPFIDSFLFAKEHFFPDDRELEIDSWTIARTILESLWITDERERGVQLHRMREKLIDSPDLLARFDALAATTLPAKQPQWRPESLGFDGDRLHFLASQFNIANVADVVQFCTRLLALTDESPRYDLPTRPEVVASNCDPLRSTIDAQARELQAIYDSWSWKASKPLRWAGSMVQRGPA